MIRRLITLLFARGHFWRSVSFDEIAELYASRLMTIFALNFVNLFAAVYLYKFGYDLLFIAWFYLGINTLRIPAAIAGAYYAAHAGPKHGILVANLLRIPALVAFALMPLYGISMVIVFGVLSAIAATWYDLCFTIDFSKVKTMRFAGKEISTMRSLDMIARVLSPVVGGIIATAFTPEATIIVASILFVLALLPLFRTVEPTRTRARIELRGFPWRLAWRSLVGAVGIGADFVTSMTIWTLFITLTVFSGAGDGVYAIVGGLASLGVCVSLVMVWLYGKMIDNAKSHLLIVFGGVANTLIHLARPFTVNSVGVVATNIASEVTTSAYAMAYTREEFDIADSSGFRIVYCMMLEVALALGICLAYGAMALGIMMLGNIEGMRFAFFVAAVAILSVLLAVRRPRRR